MTTDEKIWRRALLPTTATIQDAIRNLDQVAIKIVLVVGESGELEGTISDGDIRRGLLRGLDLNSPITTVIHPQRLRRPTGNGARNCHATNGGEQDSADSNRRRSFSNG